MILYWMSLLDVCRCYMDDVILDLYYHVIFIYFIFMFYLDIIILCIIFVFMLGMYIDVII